MAHIIQCRICKQRFDTETRTDWVMPNKGWYYHKDCYENFGKKQGAIKEGDLTIEADNDLWLDAVYKYLQKDLKIPVNFYKMKQQWDSYLKKGMTAKGIYFTLRYFYEIKKGDASKSEGGIGIIPFVYDEGTCYWGERNQRDKNICRRIEEEILKDRLNRPVIIYQKKKVQDIPVIDFSSIANEEEDE